MEWDNFPRKQGPAAASQQYQYTALMCIALSLPKLVCCPDGIAGILVKRLSLSWPLCARPILSSISVSIYSHSFSLNFYASITGKVKNASACRPALLNFDVLQMFSKGFM